MGTRRGAPAARFEPTGLGLLAGAANVVMQLSHPAVGHGVVESRVEGGQLFAHPLKRTRTTLTYLAVALLGDEDDRRFYRAAVDGAHRHVHSTPSSPVAYDAFDRRLQLWVAACLFVGIEDIDRRCRIGGDPAGAEERYRNAATLGTTLQVRPEDWPPDRAAFEDYWHAGLATAAIDSTVRRYLDDLVGLRFLPPPVPQLLGPLHRAVTAGFLPPQIRALMGYRWGAAEQRRFDAATQVLFAGSRWLPGPLRRFPFNALLLDARRRHRLGRPQL